MGRRMRNGLRHFVNQVAAAGRSPGRLGAGLAAAVFVALIGDTASHNPGGVRHWAETGVLLYLASVVVAFAGADDPSSTSDSDGLSRFSAANLVDWPSPTLPVAPSMRAAAEALAGLAVLLLFELALLTAGSAVFGWDVLPAMRAQGLMDVAILPAVAACLLPSRSQWLHLGRAAMVSVIGGSAACVSLSLVSPLPVLMTSIVLTLVLFRTSDAVARIDRRPRRAARRPPRGALARSARPPLAQLCRDAVASPFEANTLVLYAAAGAEMLALMFGPVTSVPGIVRRGLIFAATLGPALVLAESPLGLNMLDNRSRLGAQAVFGWQAPAGSMVLPLRGEWIVRAFYLHGLAAGAVFVAAVMIAIGVPPVAVWLPWALALPSFAGSRAALAAGARGMTALSQVAFLLILSGYGFGLLRYGSGEGNLGFWIGTALASGCALVGGVPPLVYLFPKRTATGR